MKSTKLAFQRALSWEKLLFLSVFLVITAAGFLQAEMLSIKGEKVNLRSGPGKNYSIKWEYGAGFPVEIIERNKNWVKVKDFENDTGWVHKSFLSTEPHMIIKANKNTEEKINIRKGPGSEHAIVGKAHYGVVLKTLQHQNDWVELQHESGLKGWISSSFLWGY